MVYNWQLQGWPDFTYDVTEVQPSILAFAQETGEVKVSKATATRNLQQLHEMGVLVQEGAGRTVRYRLNLP